MNLAVATLLATDDA